MNIAAIVQARLGSSRLPLKSLLCLRGLPVIDWVTSRLKRSQRLSQIIVATPDTALDAVLVEHLVRNDVQCVAGPEDDVLARFALAARAAQADHVVRVCADNPLVWWEAIDRLIGFYFAAGCDYAWNHIPRNNLWPDGLGAEIVSADLLYRIASSAELQSQREHCFNYIWDNAEKFSMRTFDPEEKWLCRPDLKLDLDSVEDFRKLALLPLNPEMDAWQICQACGEAGA